jgi:hypothetical protein
MDRNSGDDQLIRCAVANNGDILIWALTCGFGPIEPTTMSLLV